MKDPLHGFEKLNNITHIHKPLKPPTTHPNDPGLIIICSWAFALPKHISTYLRGYEERYPASQILLIQCDTSNLLWRPDAWQKAMYEPAISEIKTYLSAQPSDAPRVLLHVISNGGSYTAVQLSQFYTESQPQNRTPLLLPLTAMILDSCPSPPRFYLGIRAFATALPKDAFSRVVGPGVIFAALGSAVVLHVLGVSELTVAKAYRELNAERGAFVVAGVRRTYVFSRSDEMIGVEDILAHVEEARGLLEDGEKGNGERLVRTEEFVGSKHANHVSVDKERYWRIVRETWEGVVQ